MPLGIVWEILIDENNFDELATVRQKFLHHQKLCYNIKHQYSLIEQSLIISDCTIGEYQLNIILPLVILQLLIKISKIIALLVAEGVLHKSEVMIMK